MALVNKTLTLDITPGAIPQVVNVSEYDENREYTVTLIDDGGTYEIPSGTTATVEGSIGGNAFSESATVSDNTITFTLSESMTAKAGDVWAKIKLVKDSKPIQSCAFILRCDRAGVEAETIIQGSGFEEQIQDAVDDYLDNHGGGVLPSGGQSGQALLSDGADGAYWGTIETSSGSGVPRSVAQAMVTLFNAAVYTETGLTDEKAIIQEWLNSIDNIPATAISLNRNSIAFDSVGGTVQLVASVVPSNTTDTKAWSSSNTAVATVSNNGLVTAVGTGACAITVTCGNVSATASVSVSSSSQGTRGYYRVGNPTINNNILSPSEGNFVKTNMLFSPNTSPWEIRAKVKFADVSQRDYQDLFGSVSPENASVRSVLCEFSLPSIGVFLSDTDSAWKITGDFLRTSSVSANQWIWLKLGYDGTNYYIEMSTDGETFTRSTYAATFTVQSGYAVGFGMKRNAVFSGEIDLTECKIYIDGTLVWSAV